MKNLLNALIVLSWFFLIVWAGVGVSNLMWYLIYFWGVIVLSGIGWVWYEVEKNNKSLSNQYNYPYKDCWRDEE